jgi:hypothetical protein
MEAPAETPPTSPDERPADVLRRVRRIALGAYAAFAVFTAISGGFQPFLGLTCSAAVTMISFLWLEEIVDAVLQPTPQLEPWRLVLRTLLRFGRLGLALSVTIFVARFNGFSVLLGFSIVVVGIIGEALYENIRSFTG